MATRGFDVIVTGGGPAGSVLAWDLARRGVRVLLLERARFPREKVCGDYVEPRGLRILKSMGCLEELEASGPLPITHSATWVAGACPYRGSIPFYGVTEGLPPHGYIVPRDVLDNIMLKTAERAGARIEQETTVSALELGPAGVAVQTRHRARVSMRRARLVVGADGVNSVVASEAGLLADDERYIAVAQRAYAEGLEGDIGEAVFWFDESLFPGYGWMFPMAGGRANVGVGILAETRRRLGVHVPSLFATFLENLRRAHPRCAQLELAGPAIGGIVKTYGSAGANHFDGGVLVGDAGSFVDPITGEGITPAMESALLASPVLVAALSAGRFDRQQLSPYEAAFRAHFTHSMGFLDFLAAMLRNRQLARPWLKALYRGCELAQGDSTIARTSGSFFGGLDIRPPGILAQVWLQVIRDLALVWPRTLVGLLRRPQEAGTTMGDLLEWQTAWMKSAVADPLWHLRWTMDLQRKWMRTLSTMDALAADPRAAGIPVSWSGDASP